MASKCECNTIVIGIVHIAKVFVIMADTTDLEDDYHFRSTLIESVKTTSI